MTRRNRYAHLLYLKDMDSPGQPLERLTFEVGSSGTGYNEDRLQGLIYTHPEILPFGHIDPSFAPAVPLCRELPTAAGPIDVVYVSDTGLLTLAECKLWRNPEARREVVGQILDYAKEVSAWSYEDLLAAVQRATGIGGNVVYEKVFQLNDSIVEQDFVDDVDRNLRAGRFLLTIIGDGIKESVENITGFLQQHSGLHFTFALVEMALYSMPGGEHDGLVVQPRVLARTVEIERTTVRRLDDGVQLEDAAPAPDSVQGSSRGRAPSREEIIDQLASVDPGLPGMLERFFERCRERGFEITQRRSLILHWMDDQFGAINFCTVFPDGTFNTNYIAGTADEAGDLDVGVRYLEGIASLLPGGTVVKAGKPWTWRVRVDGKFPPMRELLNHEEDWLRLIDATLGDFHKLKQKMGDKPD